MSAFGYKTTGFTRGVQLQKSVKYSQIAKTHSVFQSYSISNCYEDRLPSKKVLVTILFIRQSFQEFQFELS